MNSAMYEYDMCTRSLMYQFIFMQSLLAGIMQVKKHFKQYARYKMKGNANKYYNEGKSMRAEGKQREMYAN